MATNKTGYYAGDTAKLTCEFRDWNDELVDPENVTVTVYNEYWEKLSQASDTDIFRESQGKYYYEYVTPMTTGIVIYEWRGMISGKPSIKRNQLELFFV